jgi:cell division protein FtsI (penicillin-binding protein 3)
MTVKRIFETSSNVGVSQIIYKNYSKDPQKFLDKLSSFNLDKPLGVSIPGEGPPKIKKLKSSEWYGTTLPWMSIGYETGITPIQTLCLYNAIANNGKMVKPRFVREIKQNGKTLKKYNIEVIKDQIVKPATVRKAKDMLEGVVKNGTGQGININAFSVAGKTGTAQIAFAGKSYGSEGNRSYQASFVGYFPADKPLYSCIVIIYNPTAGNFYGGLVSGPVFKEIAEKVYSSSLDFHKEINDSKKENKANPLLGKIKSEDANLIFSNLNIAFKNNSSVNSSWLSKQQDSSKVILTENGIEKSLRKGIVPNLHGLSIRDALFLLENNGLNVKVIGFGTVKRQSIEAGSKYQKGNSILLTLG